MEWTKYTIHTTEAAEDLIGYMLSEMGIIGVEIADKVPVTAAENGGYFGDVVPEMPENDHLAEISFYLKKSPKGALANAAAGGEELSATAAEDFHLPKAPIISEDFDPGTGPIRRDGESESDRREREILQADPEEVLARVRAGLAEIAEYCDIGEGTITESVTGEEDWVNNWKQYFHSFTVSGVRIVPSWEEEGLASKGGATPEGSVAGDDVVPESGAAGVGAASEGSVAVDNVVPESGAAGAGVASESGAAGVGAASEGSVAVDNVVPESGAAGAGVASGDSAAETDAYSKYNWDVVLRIDPGTAFGTGAHESTRLAIAGLRKYLKAGDRVLDIGTGSGILGMLAAKLGAAYVFATDLDPNVPAALEENLAKNAIPREDFGFILGDITSDPKVQAAAGDGYDLVLANIIAEILAGITPEVPAHIKKGGMYVTSGILITHADLVRNALAEAGFVIVEETTMGEWMSIAARKE